MMNRVADEGVKCDRSQRQAVEKPNQRCDDASTKTSALHLDDGFAASGSSLKIIENSSALNLNIMSDSESPNQEKCALTSQLRDDSSSSTERPLQTSPTSSRRSKEQPWNTECNSHHDLFDFEDGEPEYLNRQCTAQLCLTKTDDTEAATKGKRPTTSRRKSPGTLTTFERTTRRYRNRIVCCMVLFVISMVSMGITLFINEGQFSNRETPSLFPIIGPTQLAGLTPTIPSNDRADSVPCLKAVEIGLEGKTISGILHGPSFSNVTQRSFHRWCAADEVQYPIIFGPAVYYKFKGNGLTTTLRFRGGKRYRLNVYESCTTGPRAYYDESCVGSVSTFSPDYATIALDAANDINYFILISATESRENDYGAYEIALSSNDSCERASEIPIDGSILPAAAPAVEGSFLSCNSTNQVGAWYSVLGTGESYTLNTCQSTSPGTQLTVYKDGCGESQQCMGTSEIGYACAEHGSVSWVSAPNERYYIHAYGSGGMFNLSAFRTLPHDLCEGALPISTQITQNYSGDTSDATSASDAAILWSSIFPCSDYSGSPGVWYSMQGANFMNVDTCVDKGFEPQIILLQGSCDSLACTEVSVSKPCRSGSGAQVLWNLVPGETYYLFIHGQERNETGSFQLSVTAFER